LILQAYEHAEKLERDRLHKEELGIAKLTAFFMNSKIDPKKTEPFEPKQFCHWLPHEEQDKTISSAACNAFWSLIKDSLMPKWAVPLVPLDKLKANQSDAAVSRPRAWAAEGVLLLIPRIAGKVVTAEFAVIESVSGVIDVQDIDSGKWYAIEVLDRDCCIVEAEFTLIESKLILKT